MARKKSKHRRARVLATATRVPKKTTVRRQVGFDGDAPERFFTHILEEAKAGDSDKARQLLGWFCDYHDQRKPPSPTILEFLSDAFHQYLDEEIPIEKALLLARQKHRPKGVHTTKPYVLAAAYHLLIKRDELQKTKAKEKVASEFHTSARNVELAVKNEIVVSALSVQELEALLSDKNQL